MFLFIPTQRDDFFVRAFNLLSDEGFCFRFWISNSNFCLHKCAKVNEPHNFDVMLIDFDHIREIVMKI